MFNSCVLVFLLKAQEHILRESRSPKLFLIEVSGIVFSRCQLMCFRRIFYLPVGFSTFKGDFSISFDFLIGAKDTLDKYFRLKAHFSQHSALQAKFSWLCMLQTKSPKNFYCMLIFSNFANCRLILQKYGMLQGIFVRFSKLQAIIVQSQCYKMSLYDYGNCTLIL